MLGVGQVSASSSGSKLYESPPKGSPLASPANHNSQAQAQGQIQNSQNRQTATGKPQAQSFTQELKPSEEYVYTMDVHFGPDKQNVPLLVSHSPRALRTSSRVEAG